MVSTLVTALDIHTRAVGWTALCVPAARARHAGSSSSKVSKLSRRRWASLYGTRSLVAARLRLRHTIEHIELEPKVNLRPKHDIRMVPSLR